MKILPCLKKLKKRLSEHSPMVVVKISKSRLLNNLRTYQKKYPELLISPVLKSNAYGHGLIPIAEILDSENLSFFILDSLFEAKTLKKHGIKTNLLVIGYTPTTTILKNSRPDISFTITSRKQLQNLAGTTRKQLKIHLKIDTGMHRQGISMDEVPEAINLIEENANLVLEGVCSHFADADSTDSTYTNDQSRQWEQVLEEFKKVFSTIPFLHISATAGAGYTGSVPGNMLRLGLGLYGIDSSPSYKLNVKPVLQMESAVSSLRKLETGSRVGYNGTYVVEKPSSIATVPVGYFEGVDRRLSNQGAFKIDDAFCPIAGRVSMNITSLDVSNVPNIKQGANVVVISNNSNDTNSVSNMAKTAETIPWEILVHIPAHLYREVIE